MDTSALDEINSSTALIVVDLQNDFLEDGSLAVKGSNEIIPFINSILDKYPLVIATRDWHPKKHVSFASSHTDKEIGETIIVDARHQTLWPDHCIQYSHGAEITEELNIEKVDYIIDKGSQENIDSYSGFYDNSYTKTKLCEILDNHNIDTVHICGLATDYCVKQTACDATELGYKTILLSEGIRAVNLNPQDGEIAIQFMKDRNIEII